MRTLPARPIVLSFDDGYRSHVTAALPILAAHGWPGVLNLDLSNLAPAWGIPSAGVRRLIAAGWEVDAHSMTHADLSAASGPTLAREVARLATCHPPPVRDHATVLLLPRRALRRGSASQPSKPPGSREPRRPSFGLASPNAGRFTLARVRVDRGDGAAGLARKLAAFGLPTAPRGSR